MVIAASSQNKKRADMENLASLLRERLTGSVQKDPANGILFSGGLDSSIVASINPIKAIAVTVSLNHSAEDLKFAGVVAENNPNIAHHKFYVGVDEAIGAIPEVIKILNTFDPAIPNDLAAYFGLKKLKELGVDSVMTGDGSDELFAGYDFMIEVDNVDEYIKSMAPTMRFSSNILCTHFGLDIKQPYLDHSVYDLALSINRDVKIRKEGDKVWGKWILRKAFEDMLPGEVIWQKKRPLECGSGMTGLRSIITSRITDEEFEEAGASLPIKFMNKEHFYYYKIYRDVVGTVPKALDGQKTCPDCHTGLAAEKYHCRLCGCVLDRGL